MSSNAWGDTVLRSVLWLALGGWVGAWFLFAFGVSITAFRVLPSTELAGQIVGPLLTALHVYGALAGALLAGLALGLGRGPALVGLPILLAALCIYSELGVTGEIEMIRAHAFGPDATLEATQRFGVLHRRSLAIFTFVGLGAIALLVAHARYDALHARVNSPPPPASTA